MTAKEKAFAAKYLYDTVSGGHVEEVEDLLKKGAGQFIDVKHGYYKETALLTATWNKKQRIVELLLQYKADVNAENHVGRTSLMHAAINDDTVTMERLLSRGANTHAVDRCGMTALHFSAKASVRGDAVKILLDAGADVSVQCAASAYTWFFHSIDRDLQTHLFTPLHFAALACNADTVALLLKGRADPRIHDGKGRTALKLLLYHAQHITSSCKESFFKTRERLKRPHVEYPPADEQVIKPEPTPEPEIEPEPDLDLATIRRGLINVRNDLVKDYKNTNKSFGAEQTHGQKLKKVASHFEKQTTNRVAEATTFINTAIGILKDTDIRSRDPYNDYAYHRVFSFIAKEIGGKKGQWQVLAKALFRSIDDVTVQQTITTVWSHSTTETEAAHEVLARWKVYTSDKSDTMGRLKQALQDMHVSKPFLVNIDILSNEELKSDEKAVRADGKVARADGKVTRAGAKMARTRDKLTRPNAKTQCENKKLDKLNGSGKENNGILTKRKGITGSQTSVSKSSAASRLAALK